MYVLDVPAQLHVLTWKSFSTLFYVGGVLVSGLLVPADDYRLGLGDKGDKTGRSSPFVIAFKRAGWAVVRPHSPFTPSSRALTHRYPQSSSAPGPGERGNPVVSVVRGGLRHLHQQPVPVLPRATRARPELPRALIHISEGTRSGYAFLSKRQRLRSGRGLRLGERHRYVPPTCTQRLRALI